MKASYLQVAKIGKTNGLQGGVKLHIIGDFTPHPTYRFYILDIPNSFVPIKMLSFDTQRNIAIFENYQDIALAQNLTNKILYSHKDDTLQDIKLNDNEYFYFEIIGFDVIDTILNIKLGKVIDIDRIGNIDYLMIEHERKKYMIPYIDRYVINISKNTKEILCKDILGILENS